MSYVLCLSDLAKTTLHCSPSFSMTMLLIYLFAVCLSGHVAEADGGMHPYVKYGFGSPKFIWAPCHVMCAAVIIGWDPTILPIPPHLDSMRTVLISQDRRHLLVTPCMHPTSLPPTPDFLADSISNLAKTTLPCSPSSSMVMLLMYLFAVCLSCHIAEANGGHAGHGEVERSHVHRELRRTSAHLIKENALVTKLVI